MKKINSVLIANRGEIAIRIAKTLTEMSIKSYGIYADDDASSDHLSYMENNFLIPGSGPSSYTNIKSIIKVLKENNIEAVHPGYGFLSESAEFCHQCEKNSIIFLGPNKDVLKKFGDKEESKILAQKLKIPVCQTFGEIKSSQDITNIFKKTKSKKIILKSNFGGGGRGSRLISKGKNYEDTYNVIKNEALSFSGSSCIFAEEYIENARHIEVQILGDGEKCIHLFERDCSFQRNFQKIIEITPAPNLKQSTKNLIYQYATRICEEVSFKGLATVEFLVSKGQRIFFIEVNPRIQVEHTITEELTRVDLVRAQINIFSGLKLKDLKLETPIKLGNRASIQARLNMEEYDANKTLLPGLGIIQEYNIVSGPGLRFDGYGKVGYENKGHYDSLLTKIIASSEFGINDAVKKLIFALEKSVVKGIATNKNLLISILRNEEFFEANFDASTLDKKLNKYLLSIKNENKSESVLKDTQRQKFPQKTESIKNNDNQFVIKSNLIGTIIEINISNGQEVMKGDAVLIQESMKMHHSLKVERSGKIGNIFVEVGDTVSINSDLFELLPIKGSIDPSLKLKNSKKSKSIRDDLKELRRRRSYNLDKNRSVAVKKRKLLGKRTARENIKRLTDNNEFFEYGDLVYAAQRSRRSLSDLIENTPADGLITGISNVNSNLFDANRTKTAIMHYDYMVLAGTQGMNNHKKLDRMINVVKDLEIPLIFFCEGGGGRPGDVDAGDQNIAGLNIPSFHDFPKLSGLVPLIGIGSGRLFAGNAALLGCCDVIIATKDLNLGMGGPAMIEGGGLGIFKPEEVGPTSVQYPNGVIDILVENEDEAVDVSKKYLSYFQGNFCEWKEPNVKDLRNVIPENRLEVYDIHEVIELIADKGSILEIKAGFAKGMFTGFIRVEGRPIGLIGNNPMYLAGAIDSDCADKASRFIQICENYKIPILSLCDTPGMMVGPEVEKTGLVRHCCRLFLVGANISVPMMTIVLRKAYGLGAQAMAGGSFIAPQFVVGWPTAEIGAMGLEGAVKLGYRKELEAEENLEKRDQLFRKLVDDLYEKGKGINAASLLEFDTVLDPAETRKWISMLIKNTKISSKLNKKTNYIDAW